MTAIVERKKTGVLKNNLIFFFYGIKQVAKRMVNIRLTSQELFWRKIMNVLKKIFGTHSDRELKRLEPIADQVEALKEQMQSLTDEELRGKTEEYRRRHQKGESLDDLLVEAFATVREVSRRVCGMEHYRVQILGGIILHQGRIAQMCTGEGKTLVSTLPAYLNALEGKGVHIVTVNDYLAKRDKELVEPIHEFLGLRVGVVLNDMSPEERKAAYSCDITYVTNSELGFDYLRDNMAIQKSQRVLRGLHYAVIDEIDSVLIDEARTPLIISAPAKESTKIYEQCNELASQMERGKDIKELSKLDILSGMTQEEDGDFVINEKEKQILLTAQGVEKIEAFFGIDNFADVENFEIQHLIIVALRARNLMFRDRDYVVKEDEVLLVDEFTGRIMPGRRFSEGLHQAIEAKEGVPIQEESKTLASITYQSFFNLFDKKGGMTGTAQTEEQEFREIYGLDIVQVPTNRPVIRKDLEDAVYKTKQEKMEAIVQAVEEAHAKGQPVLVGTITIDTSEELSQMLTKKQIPHHVLNAKYHELEAEIIAKAGRHGAVTIATNMAGRGTDIKLDEEARAAGGLSVIGSERHDSRRIDDQLRGRSGRQGDPGKSRFYISLEDNLFRLFGSERMKQILETMGVKYGEMLEHKMLSDAMLSAQKRVESRHFEERKKLMEYDQVLSEQREFIYEQRNRVLNGEDMLKVIRNMIRTSIDYSYEADEETLRKMTEEVQQRYDEKCKEFPSPEAARELERFILLQNIDKRWMEHVDAMELLRQSIGLQSYAQRDPLVEYKRISYEMFEKMSKEISVETVNFMFNVQVEVKFIDEETEEKESKA